MSGGEIPISLAIADITQLVMGKPTLVQNMTFYSSL